MKNSRRLVHSPKILIISFAAVFGIALIGSFFTSKSVNSYWYESIKPDVTPPGYVFPIAWSILFVLIALSLYFAIIKSSGAERKIALLLFSANLVLNALWSFLFFTLQNPFLALIELSFMGFTILALIFFLYKIDKLASYLLIPYFLWVSFAAALNYLIVMKV